jgi:hypothetical protein
MVSAPTRDAQFLPSASSPALALNLAEMFGDEWYAQDCVVRLRNQLERLFRLLLTERTGSDMGFRVFSQTKFSKWDRAVLFSQKLLQHAF